MPSNFHSNPFTYTNDVAYLELLQALPNTNIFITTKNITNEIMYSYALYEEAIGDDEILRNSSNSNNNGNKGRFTGIITGMLAGFFFVALLAIQTHKKRTTTKGTRS